MTPEQRDLIGRLAAMATREHHDCTDIRFTACAKHPLGKHLPECSADCDCGADEHNAAVAAIAAELLAEPPASEAGLHGKYTIAKASAGEPIDFPAFVLRIDGKDEDAIEALRVYGKRHGGELGKDIERLVNQLGWATPTLPLPGSQPDIEVEG